MSSIISKYGAAIFSFAITLLTIVSSLKDTSFASLFQLIPLIITSLLVLIVPLIKGPWAGAIKTGIEIIGVIAVLLIPYVVAGTITVPQLLVVGVAILKAVATQLGIIIRLDPTVGGGADLAAVTSTSKPIDGQAANGGV